MRLAAAVAALTAVAACFAATAVRAGAPVAVRSCADRGESTQPIRQLSTAPGDVVLGRRVALRNLKRFAARKVLLGSVAGGPNRVYFAKAGAVVRAGAPVTISIVPADRDVAALVYVHGTGQGLRLGVPVVRLVPCAPSTKAFAYKGTVGPFTYFPGGFVVKRPTCVTVVVTSPTSKAIRRKISLGAGTCRR